MPLRLACPRCAQYLEVSDDQAGKIVTCPGCQRRLAIPVPRALPVSDRATETPLQQGPRAEPEAAPPAASADYDWKQVGGAKEVRKRHREILRKARRADLLAGLLLLPTSLFGILLSLFVGCLGGGHIAALGLTISILGLIASAAMIFTGYRR